MNAEQNPCKSILISVIKCYIAFTLGLYLALLGVSVLFYLTMGEVFNFDFRGEFVFCLKKSIPFGVLYGVGDWVMRKVKKIDKDKK
ncbi:hypothetical protein D0525_24365 [Salmonella enterica]|nr:hypothetical protein D0525_24365 [Salmonella enterica]